MEQAYAIRDLKYRIGKYILRLLVIEGYLSAGQFETLRDLLIDKEKSIVHRDGTITFAFYNGTEIAVERQAA